MKGAIKMSEEYDEVLGRLKSYRSAKRKIEQLQFELRNHQSISEDELIESIALGFRLGGGGYSRGHLTDKTMAIALHYKGAMKKMGDETKRDILKELCRLVIEVDRLERYVSLLEEREREVVTMLFFEGKKWAEAWDKLDISKQALSSCRKSAINQLASMYSLVKNIGATGT